MCELIDLREIFAAQRELADYEREERERVTQALQRLTPILADVRTVLRFIEEE